MIKKYSDFKDFLPLPDFSKTIIECDCPNCYRRIYFPLPSSEAEVYDKHEQYIKELHNGYDALVDELQEFFPNTPIKDYFEMKRTDLQNCFKLLTKRLNKDFNEVDEIHLKANFWFKKMEESKKYKPPQ